MNGTVYVALFLITLLLCACGQSESVKRLRSLSVTDCRDLQAKVSVLCAAYVPSEDLDDALLFGEKIPEALRPLKPQAVRIGRDYCIIYLHKTPAGEDSISVFRSADGSWSIETREGNWMNPAKVIWTSAKEPN